MTQRIGMTLDIRPDKVNGMGSSWTRRTEHPRRKPAVASASTGARRKAPPALLRRPPAACPSPHPHPPAPAHLHTQVAEYTRLHDEQWPEVHDALHSVGVRNLSIWHLAEPAAATNRLFIYMEYVGEAPFDEAMARYAAMPRVQEWEELMRTMQVQLPGSAPGVWWQRMAQLFHQA
jgi:L-rhamnose mutarotase